MAVEEEDIAAVGLVAASLNVIAVVGKDAEAAHHVVEVVVLAQLGVAG